MQKGGDRCRTRLRRQERKPQNKYALMRRVRRGCPGSNGGRTSASEDLPRGDHESPGCIKRERIVASKKVAPRAEPTSEGRQNSPIDFRISAVPVVDSGRKA